MKEVCESPLRLESRAYSQCEGVGWGDGESVLVCHGAAALKTTTTVGLLAVFRCHNSAYVIPRLLLTSHATTQRSTLRTIRELDNTVFSAVAC